LGGHDRDPAVDVVQPEAAGVAVVTTPLGVLASRRPDGIPRWMSSRGTDEEGETPEEAG
jgi:hypothetical protein